MLLPLALLLLCPPLLRAQGDAPLERVYWYQGRIIVTLLPQPNEGYLQLARRVMAEPDHEQVRAFNRGRPLMAGREVHLPLNWLTLPLRGMALRKLYPEDDISERGWFHTVTDPLENLIQLTEAYTGSSARFKELARLNDLNNPDVLRLGQTIVVPLKWIPEELGLSPDELKAPLELVREESSGRYFATYQVQPNDTLYSLLLRFTDRERAEEINRMSGLLADLNGLASADTLRAGQRVRLPLEWVVEDYQDPGEAVAVTAPGLQPPAPAPPKPGTGPSGPLHVIIDAGHGGSDPGAVYGSRRGGDLLYEHEVVYDIALRLARLLEERGHHVYTTVEDPGQPEPVETLDMSRLGGERLRVTPPYIMDSANAAINLRVFFVHALHRHLVEQGVPSENIVLLSIHGDALAATLRGAMVYFPDHRLRAPKFGPSGRIYRIREEAVPRLIHFNQSDNRAAHDASKAFADLVVQGLAANDVRVSARKPVRGFYYREGERTLPAVLRYSTVPTSVLVEVANLNNSHDRAEMRDVFARKRVALGLATALDYYRDQQATIALSDAGS